MGATHPLARSVEGKEAMEPEARFQKPLLPDRASAPRSASPSGRAMTSEAVDMKEATKASDWRSWERRAGSVAVGAGVGVGEGVGLGEAAPDCLPGSDCAPDCASSAVGEGVGLGTAVGWGPRGIRSGSTASVTPEVPARVRIAERSAWLLAALAEVHGTTVETREAATCAPESHTRIVRSLPEKLPELAATVVTRGPHSSESDRGSEEVGMRISKGVVVPRATSVSVVEAACVASGSSSLSWVVSAETEMGVSLATNTSRATEARVVGESLRIVPEMTTSLSLVIIRGERESMETDRPESVGSVPMTAGRDCPSVDVAAGAGAAPAS